MSYQNSKDKMDVEVVDTPWGKDWVRVTLKNGKVFYPSFADLHRIIRAICRCEDKKYPSGKGRKMVAAFLYQACFEDDFEKLAREYEIPVRDSEGKVIKTNKKVDNFEYTQTGLPYLERSMNSSLDGIKK